MVSQPLDRPARDRNCRCRGGAAGNSGRDLAVGAIGHADAADVSAAPRPAGAAVGAQALVVRLGVERDDAHTAQVVRIGVRQSVATGPFGLISLAFSLGQQGFGPDDVSSLGSALPTPGRCISRTPPCLQRCQRALFLTEMPTRCRDSCVTTGPLPLARIRRPGAPLMQFNLHHSWKVRI